MSGFPWRLAEGLLPLSLATLAIGQYQAAPGFAAATVFREGPQVHHVRGVAHDPFRGTFYLALDHVLFYRPDTSTWLTVHALPPGDDVGAVRFDQPSGRLYFTSLQSGQVFVHDPAALATTAYAGVANGFDLAIAATGEVLLAANPNWPQPGSNSGIWHVGRGRAPREILRLSGPSAPLAFDRHDNLIAAELGSNVPPPAGSVRLLRFPAARVAAVLASSSAQLTPGDADAIAAGWSGAYGLAVDDCDRLYVTDPGRNVVLRTPPASLVPEIQPVCTLPGYGLQLQFVSSFGDPWRAMRAYQPGDQTSALLVCSSDFSSEFLVGRLQPERPRLAVAPGPVLGAGSAHFTCSGAPPHSLVLFAFAAPALAPETVVAFADGTPIWLSLPAANMFVAATAIADAQGLAPAVFLHPGGFAASLQAQALALGPPGSGLHGTSAPLGLTLLP